MPKNLHQVAVVSLATMASRVLGLGRDVLVFSLLGAGAHNSAFLLAFTLPNLFRRMLGEGALTSALVPVLAGQMEQGTKEEAFRFFNRVLTRVGLVLLGLMGLLWAGSGVALAWPGLPERWERVAWLNLLLAPYLPLICGAAMVAAALNLQGRFAAPALSPVWLNLAMMGFLGAGALAVPGLPAVQVGMLCLGVLAGGCLQLGVPGLDLWREGWRPRVDPGPDEGLRHLWRLLLPGLAGAAVLQVNILVSRVIAYNLDDAAVSVLYLAGRLMELPLGVFTVAVVTVAFPGLARMAAGGNEEGFREGLLSGLRLVVAITLPAGLGLWILGRPILDTLFGWGAFRGGDIALTAPVLAIYGLGLPVYSVATLAVRALHAVKDMQTPLRAAVVVLALNVILSLALMQVWAVNGLALANVVATAAQAGLLLAALHRRSRVLAAAAWLRPLGKILLAGGTMALAVAGVRWAGEGWLGAGKAAAALVTVAGVGGGAGLYLGMLAWLRFEEMEPLGRLLGKLSRRIRGEGGRK